MSVFSKLWDLIKDILPILKSAAEKAFDKLPKDAQDKLIQISKLIQIIKLAYEDDKTITTDELLNAAEKETGLTSDEIENMTISYVEQKGQQAGSFAEAVKLIWQDAQNAGESGIKAIWAGAMQILGDLVSHVDWETLLLGIGQFVYDKFVKRKVKI